jgi:putative hydrolase of the HAD superfamily
MLTLALDVDGVLLDPGRNGDGPWTNELTARFGLERVQIDEAFFMQGWDDVVNGRRSVEEGLGEALGQLGATVDVESVLSCWFDADYAPIEETFDLARRAALAGCRVVLATNQEHRRADYLRRRIGAVVPLDRVLYSADVGCQKHDRRFFEVASEHLGLTAAEWPSVVFVDDVMANVEVARSVGWRAVHASTDQPWRQEVAEHQGLQL